MAMECEVTLFGKALVLGPATMVCLVCLRMKTHWDETQTFK